MIDAVGRIRVYARRAARCSLMVRRSLEDARDFMRIAEDDR